MKRFLSYTCIVAIMVIIPLIAMEVYVEQMPNPTRDKHLWMQKNSSRVETLILGSSHTFYGINPKYLGNNAYNAAEVSQTYRYDCDILLHYPMPHLKYVILPYSYFSIWEDLEAPDQQWQTAIRYCIYTDYKEHTRLSRYGLEMFSMNTLWEKMHSLWQPAQLIWDSLGFGTNYTLQDRESNWDNGKERAQFNTYSDTTVIAHTETYLQEMAEYCKRHGAQFVIITTPVTQSFRKNQEARQIAINKRVLDRFLHRYPNVRYIDYEADQRFSSNDFYDSDHLNTDGAKKLTLLLRDTLGIR